MSKAVNKDIRSVRGSRGTPGVSGGVRQGIPGGQEGCPRGRGKSRGSKRVKRDVRGVKGLKEAPRIYDKTDTFCKIYFHDFARNKWSDHDFENWSEIRRVTRNR